MEKLKLLIAEAPTHKTWTEIIGWCSAVQLVLPRLVDVAIAARDLEDKRSYQLNQALRSLEELLRDRKPKDKV